MAKTVVDGHAFFFGEKLKELSVGPNPLEVLLFIQRIIASGGGQITSTYRQLVSIARLIFQPQLSDMYVTTTIYSSNMGINKSKRGVETGC